MVRSMKDSQSDIPRLSILATVYIYDKSTNAVDAKLRLITFDMEATTVKIPRGKLLGGLLGNRTKKR